MTVGWLRFKHNWVVIGGFPVREITAGIIERALEALARGDHSDGPLKGSTVNLPFRGEFGPSLRGADRVSSDRIRWLTTAFPGRKNRKYTSPFSAVARKPGF